MAERVTTLTIRWGQDDLPPEKRYEWLAAWVVATDGQEGDFFYEGPGGAAHTFAVPEGAIGFKLRCGMGDPADGSQPGTSGMATTAAQYFGDAGGEFVFEAMSLPV